MIEMIKSSRLQLLPATDTYIKRQIAMRHESTNKRQSHHKYNNNIRTYA